MLGKKKIEFDFSPRPWMLKIMRHLRLLRTVMPEWHKREREISVRIRGEILSGKDKTRLKQLDQVKGYRDVRYAAAETYKV